MALREGLNETGLAHVFVVSVGRILLVLYVAIGLGLSGVEAVSRFASVAAILGVSLYFLSHRNVPRGLGGFLLVAIYFSLTWLWAKDATIGILGNYLTAVLGGLLIYLSVRAKWVSPEGAVFILLVPFLINLYAYAVGDNLTSVLFDLDEDAAFKRFGGYVGHPNALVTRLIAPLVVFAFWVPYLRKRKIVVGLFVLTLVSALFAVYASGSKKSLVLMLPPLIMALVQFSRKDPKYGRENSGVTKYIWMAFLGILLAILINMSGGDIEVFSRIESFLGGDDESTYERQLLVAIAPPLIYESPFFGHGLDQYAVVSGVGFYSHNNYVESLVNTGLVGFLMYYYVFFEKLGKLRLQSNGSLLFALCFTLFLALDVTGVTYGDRGAQVMMMAFYLRAVIGDGTLRRKNG